MTPTELTELDRMLAEFMGFRLRTEIGKDYGGDFPPDAAEYYNDGTHDVCMACDWHPTTDIAQLMMCVEKTGEDWLVWKNDGKYAFAFANQIINDAPFMDTLNDAIALQFRAWLAAQPTAPRE